MDRMYCVGLIISKIRPWVVRKVGTDTTHVRLQTEYNESDFDLPHYAADPHIVVNCKWTWTFHLQLAILIREMTYQLVPHRSF